MRTGLFVVLALWTANCKATQPTITVAGASDLVFVMEEVIVRFEKQTGQKVKFIPGSSGKLAAQIKEGAPYDVYFSANVAFVNEVIASGSCAADTKASYARGRLAIWTGEDDTPPVPADIKGLADPGFAKIGIANPEHAPRPTEWRPSRRWRKPASMPRCSPAWSTAPTSKTRWSS
jgi:ABC-type molybdate transport system substrate-binding protein